MTDDRAILICSSCTKPYRLVTVESGSATASVNCPYCNMANISEAQGIVRAEAIADGERAFFWDADRRQRTLTGRADSN